MDSIELQKAAGGVLFALITLFGINMLGDALFSTPEDHAASGRPATASKPESMPPPPAAEQPFPALLAAATEDQGKQVAKKCLSCHAFDEAGGNKVGPNLHGTFNRQKAAVPGFAYSEAMKAKGGAWTQEDLNAFLAKPGSFVPGTKMSFAGLSNAQERAAIIKYLHAQTPGAPPLQ